MKNWQAALLIALCIVCIAAIVYLLGVRQGYWPDATGLFSWTTPTPFPGGLFSRRI